MAETTETTKATENAKETIEVTKPKYEKRNNVKDMNAEARLFIAEAMSDLKKYQAYLDVMAQFVDYTAMNCAQIALHRPQAIQLFDSQTIKEAHGFINKGEKGVPIVAPKWVAGKNGEPGKTYFNVKYMFARDQQHGAHLEQLIKYNSQVVLGAMRQVDSCPAPQSREGLYIVGKHFGLEGVFIDKLPEIPQTEDLDEVLENCVSYMKDVQAETKRFCYALEKKCGELVSEKMTNRNERVAAAFERVAQKAQFANTTPEQEAQDSAPAQKTPEKIKGAAKNNANMTTKEKLAAAKAQAAGQNKEAAKPVEKPQEKEASAR